MNLPPLPSAETTQIHPNTAPTTASQPGTPTGPAFSAQFDQAIAASQTPSPQTQTQAPQTQPQGQPQPNISQPVQPQSLTGVPPTPQLVSQPSLPQAAVAQELSAIPQLNTPGPQITAQPVAVSQAQTPSNPKANQPIQPPSPTDASSEAQPVFPPCVPAVPEKPQLTASNPAQPATSQTATPTLDPQLSTANQGTPLPIAPQQTDASDPSLTPPPEQGTTATDEPKPPVVGPKKKESRPDPTEIPFVWQAPVAPLVETIVSAKLAAPAPDPAPAPAPISEIGAQSTELATPQKEAAETAPKSNGGFALPPGLTEENLPEKEVANLLASAPSAPPKPAPVPGADSGGYRTDVQRGSTTFSPPPKTPDPLGTPVATSSSHMVQAPEQNEFAARTQQYLPDPSTPSKDPENTAHSKPAHSEATLQVDAVPQFQVRPEHVTSSTAPSDTVPTEHTRTTTQSLFNSISHEVSLMRQISPDKLSVVLRPDADTQIALQLRVRNGAVEGTARCERGDYQLLSAHWTDLQRSFDQKGIHLEPLRDSSFGFNYSGGSFGGSAHQDQRGRRLEQAIIPEPFAVSKPTTKPRPVSLETRTGQTLLQTWA